MNKHAHWYVLVLVLVLAIGIVTISGFVPTYFINLDKMLPQHHFHLVAAVTWLLMPSGGVSSRSGLEIRLKTISRSVCRGSSSTLREPRIIS